MDACEEGECSQLDRVRELETQLAAAEQRLRDEDREREAFVLTVGEMDRKRAIEAEQEVERLREGIMRARQRLVDFLTNNTGTGPVYEANDLLALLTRRSE